MSWDRFEKLVSLIKQRITTTVLYRLKDPRLGFVTITGIELSRDLKTCKVSYSVIGEKGDKAKTARALQDARGYIQKEVGKTLRTRIMPRVEFAYDDSMEKTERILRAIREARKDSIDIDQNGDAEDVDDGDLEDTEPPDDHDRHPSEEATPEEGGEEKDHDK